MISEPIRFVLHRFLSTSVLRLKYVKATEGFAFKTGIPPVPTSNALLDR